MPLVNISHEAALAIQGAAKLPFRQTGSRCADGSWDIPIEQSTLDAVQQRRHPGESLSDALIRIVATAERKPN